MNSIFPPLCLCAFVFNFFLVCVDRIDAACCHAIIFADTFSPTKSAVRSELEASSSELSQLCLASDLEYCETRLFGEGGHQSLLTAIDALHPSTEDLVFFVFLGHGYRKEYTQSPWPTFLFFQPRESVAMHTVIDRLKRLPARFLCVIADCCNHSLRAQTKPARRQACNFLQTSSAIPTPIHACALLSTGKGAFILAAARAGSPAYCTRRRHLCSAAFWQALHEQSLQEAQSWEEVGLRVAQLLAPLQTPFYVLNP